LPYVERDVEAQARLAAFSTRLQELGWLDGRNARIDLRWAEGNVEHLRTQAVELAGTTPDVILAGNTLALIALQKATHITYQSYSCRLPTRSLAGLSPTCRDLAAI
jgi:ABC-type uncharacterized transport system substrate-binding protein